MVGVLMVMTMMLGMSAALHSGIMNDTSLRGAHARAVSGFYAAEAGINRGMGDYRNIFMSYNTPSGSDFDQHQFTLGPRTIKYKLSALPGYPQTVTVPQGETFGGLNSIHYRYTARSTSEVVMGDTEVTLGTEFDVNYIPLFQFLAFYQNDLEILPGPTMTLHGPIHTNGSLFLSSGATLTVSDQVSPPIPYVRITATGDVWRGRKNDSSCTGTVRISKLSTTAGYTPPLPLLNMNCSSGSRVKQTDAQLANWLGSIKAHVAQVAVPQPDVINRGTGEFWQKADLRIVLNLDNRSDGFAAIEVQDVNGNVDPVLNPRLQAFMNAAGTEGRIFYNDVPKDIPNARNSAHVNWYRNTGAYTPAFTGGLTVDMYPCPRTSILALCSSADWATCTAGGGALCANYQSKKVASSFVTGRRAGFFNNRENRWVYMLNVNVHDLLEWNRAQPAGNRLVDPDDTTDGGLVIFLSVEGPTSITGPVGANDPAYGVRVFGTPNFDFPPAAGGDPTGVTIVSDQAAYVEGHYNVNTGQTLYDAGHPKMPAAIMADAINVLSANWSGIPTAFGGSCRNDCQSGNTLVNRPARNTFINAAFLGGVDNSVFGTTTTPGTYNGGLENYPRFHENWTGFNLTYRGSFVTLGTALRSFGAWCGTGSGCNIYNAPNRLWDFDIDFQTVAQLPPLTPRVLTVEQVLFTENFR